MQPVFFISGPIKKYPSISAMIKLSKAPKDSPTKFIVTFGMKGYSFKLSDIIKIKGLDVFELKTPVLFMTNGQNQSAFDIENGMINPNTIGAITRLNSGVTIESELASKGILTTILGSFLNKLGSALRLRVYIPSTAKSAKDVKISLVPEEDKPIKLCLKDFSILNQLPNFFNKIQNSCFESSSLSVAIDEKGKAAVSVIGTASILNVPSKIEAHLKDGHYIMGIKVASLNTLINEIPGLSLVNKQFDKIFSLTELELIASDTTGNIQLKPEKYKKEPADEFSDEDLMALFGEDLGEAEASGLDVVPGVSLLARLTVTNVVPLIKDLLASISLDPAQIQINIPPGAQKIQDVKIRLKPEDPTQQVCISRAIIPILKLVDVGSLGDKLSSILSILCLGTDFNIVFDNGMNMVVVVSGDLKKFGGKLMAKFTPQKKEAVLGVELAQQLKFEDISSVLKPLDNIMTLGTPTILLTNQQNATVFDIENGIINPNASTAIAVPYGLSLEIKLVPGAQTDAILKQMPISQKLLSLMRIRVLFTKTGPQVSFVRADHKPIEICLKDLPGIAQLPSNSIVNSIKDTCVTVNELTFDRGDNGLLFNINAKAKILGIDNVDLQIGVNGQQSLIAANIPQLNLAKLPAPFPSIANVISLTNTQLVISNYSANQTIFGTPTAVENGLNIIGDIAFENPFGQVLALFGIDRLRATISITKESGSEQVKISATKSIDKSFGNIVKCKNLTLNFLSGIPPKGPIFGLAIDSILSIGDKPLEIVFNVSLGASSIQISGELSCLKGAACPAIEKPFKMPITLRALPAGTAGFPQGLPISVTISMLGGAPVGLGGSGAFVLGDNNFVTNFYFDFSQPDLYGLMFRANQLCLDDIIQLFTLFLAQEVQKALGLSFIPDLFCLQNVDVSMASKSMTINKVALNQGVVASGDFIIPLLGNLKGLANFNLRVPTLELSTLSAIDKIGIFADGILEPLILSMGNINLFSLTGSSKDKQAKGPTLHLAVGKNNQEFNLSGKLNILNGFINDDVLIKIDKTKMSFDLKRDFAGISETISGTLGFDSSQLANISKMSTADIQQLLLNNWQIKGELNVEQLNNAITGNLKTVIAGWQSSLSVLSSVQETFLGACDKITGYLNPFFTFDCSSCLKNIGPLGAINTVLQTLTDWIKNLSTVFKLESASFTYSLQDLVNVKSPSYTVKYKLFGDEKTVTLQLDPTHPQKMIDTFFEIIKTAIQPADLANALKLVAKMGTDAAANIKKLLDTTFTCKFKTKFVKDNIDLSVSFNPMHPEQVVAQAMLNQLCLGDLLNLSDSFGASVPKITFPALGCLKNVTILISASKINIKGTMSILGLDSFVEGVIDGSGITLNGLLPSISILNGLFSLTDSTDSSKGPNFALVMTKDKQEIDLSGVLTVFKKISQVTDVIVSPQKLKFQMTGEVPGLTLDILGEAVSSFPLKNMKINATVKNKLDELVLAGVKSGTSLLKSGAATVFKEIDQIFSDIKHKVDDAPVVGGLLSGLVSKAGSVVNRAKVPLDLLNKTIDQFLDSFGIDSIVLSGDINAFDTNTTSPVKVSILYHLGSSNKNLKIDVLFGSADFVSVLIKKIAEDVVTNIKNAVTDPNKQLKDFKNNMSDILKEVIKEVANAIGAFFEDIANKAGEAVLELGKDVLNIANNAAELALNIANQIGDALGNASEVINEALKASADAASDAAQVAAKAAGKAAEEAAKVAAKAAEEATKVAGKAAEEAGKAVGKAAVAAAKAAAKAVSDAMKDVADFFGF